MSARFAIAPRRRHASRSRARGFSLIELIAAFLVFALGVGILMQTLASSMRSTRLSSDYTQAALWAESLLDTVGVGEPVREGSSSGDFDQDYRWRLDIKKIDPQMVDVRQPVAGAGANTGGKNGQNRQTQQVAPPVAAGQPDVPVDLFQVDLVVSWGDRMRPREAHFGTLLSANPDAGGLGAPPGMQAPGIQSPMQTRGSRPQLGGGR